MLCKQKTAVNLQGNTAKISREKGTKGDRCYWAGTTWGEKVVYQSFWAPLVALFKLFSRWLVVKNPPANAGDREFEPWDGKNPRGGHGNPLQYSCLENPWTEEPRGYSPWVHQKVRRNLVTKQQLFSSVPRTSAPLASPTRLTFVHSSGDVFRGNLNPNL